MSEPKNGGPAFPWQITIPAGAWNPVQQRNVPANHTEVEIMPGMSLLDWFAGQALAGGCGYGTEAVGSFNLAEAAYDIAEAMIAESQRRAGK